MADDELAAVPRRLDAPSGSLFTVRAAIADAEDKHLHFVF